MAIGILLKTNQIVFDNLDEYAFIGELSINGELRGVLPMVIEAKKQSIKKVINALIGGGTFAKPGEASLTHNGVLFLDEIAEFNKNTLEALRQPMEDNCVSISRVRQSQNYPANFMLIAAMNLCPCGYYGEDRCHCTDYEVIGIETTVKKMDLRNAK